MLCQLPHHGYIRFLRSRRQPAQCMSSTIRWRSSVMICSPCRNGSDRFTRTTVPYSPLSHPSPYRIFPAFSLTPCAKRLVQPFFDHHSTVNNCPVRQIVQHICERIVLDAGWVSQNIWRYAHPLLKSRTRYCARPRCYPDLSFAEMAG